MKRSRRVSSVRLLAPSRRTLFAVRVVLPEHEGSPSRGRQLPFFLGTLDQFVGWGSRGVEEHREGRRRERYRESVPCFVRICGLSSVYLFIEPRVEHDGHDAARDASRRCLPSRRSRHSCRSRRSRLDQPSPEGCPRRMMSKPPILLRVSCVPTAPAAYPGPLPPLHTACQPQEKNRQESFARIEKQLSQAASRADNLLAEADGFITLTGDGLVTPPRARGSAKPPLSRTGSASCKDSEDPLTYVPSAPPQPSEPPKKQRGASRHSSRRGGGGSGGVDESESSESESSDDEDKPDPHTVPVSLSEGVAVPLLRARVEAFRLSGSGDGTGGDGCRSCAAAAVGTGSHEECNGRARALSSEQPIRMTRNSTKAEGGARALGAAQVECGCRASGEGTGGYQRSTRNSRAAATAWPGAGMGFEERRARDVGDEMLLEIYRYWAKKRQAYGGPMLRCFHRFMMRKWKRMEDREMEVRRKLLGLIKARPWRSWRTDLLQVSRPKGMMVVSEINISSSTDILVQFLSADSSTRHKFEATSLAVSRRYGE